MAVAQIVLPAALLNLLLAIPAVQIAGSLERSIYPPKVAL
jgi:hypothetical protein